MFDSIRAAHAAGMPIYAECGGLMVLTQNLTNMLGSIYPMIGLLPGYSRMKEKLTMGYRQVRTVRDCLLASQGQTIKGHEFHYSDWTDYGKVPHMYEITPRFGDEPREEGFAFNNLQASYVHLHFAAHPKLADNFVKACYLWQRDNI
jgi:cobyrinic acid a,c-diamide synthase